MTNRIRTFLLSGCAAAALAFAPGAQAVNVGLELALLIDVSGSVSNSEYNLQMQGYQQAFNNPLVQTAIANNPTGSIAVAVIQWSSSSSQQLSISFTQITSATAGAFGDQIGALARAFSGSTAPGSAINFATPLFAANSFDAPRQVIDVSGDGDQNSGADTSDARDAAVAAGIDTINGVTIGGGASLFNFYVNNIQAGPGSFVLAANSFADFAGVIVDKLVREVSPPGIPVPAAAALFGAGLLGLALVARTRRTAG